MTRAQIDLWQFLREPYRWSWRARLTWGDVIHGTIGGVRDAH
jgi:hypothetical protein